MSLRLGLMNMQLLGGKSLLLEGRNFSETISRPEGRQE